MHNRTTRSDQTERNQERQRRRRHDDDAENNPSEETHEHKQRSRGHHGGDWGHHGRRHGRRGDRRGDRRRGRAKRGEMRYILLDLLRDGPKHGYEMIKALEERTAQEYVPSPGTVYPTLQYLEDQGLVRAEQDAERRVYHLTDAGQAELVEQAASIDDFWAQFEPQPANSSRPEVRFLEEELEHLNRIVWSGLREAIAQDNQEQVRQVRQVIEACQTAVREAIAGNAAQ